MSRHNIFMLRQSSGQRQKVSCRDNIFLGRDRVWPRQKGFMSRQSILCRDSVWPRPKGLVLRQSNLCHDRVWLRPRNFMSRQKYFMSRQDFIEWCCNIMFYVTTQSARERSLFVSTEIFYVAIELVRPGVFCRDIMILCRNRVGNVMSR